MLLIVILNAVLAATVLGVILALHAKAIAADQLDRGSRRSSLPLGVRTSRSARHEHERRPVRRPVAV